MNIQAVRERRPNRAPPRSKLQEVTIREFGGGLNVVDNDISLSTKFSKVEDNIHRGLDGSKKLRYGTSWFADVTGTVTGTVVNVTYFANKLVAVTTTGQIATVTDAGVVALIWDTATAAALPGAPAGWSAMTRCDFAEFKGGLIICNGIDKPILVSSSHAITYLQDLGTGSNANTPIGAFCTTTKDFLIIAGISATDTTLYVSNRNTSGTFLGDPAPNDSVTFDVGAYAPSDNAEIRGISSFRNFLFVHFFAATVVVELGNYDTAATPNHVPTVSDTVPQSGIASHMAATALSNDLFFGDVRGVSTMKRNIFAAAVDSTRISELVAPDFQTSISGLTEAEMQTQVFAVWDELNKQYVLHIDQGDGTSEVWVYTFSEKLKVRAWSKYVGWNWTAGCASALGRVFYTTGSKIFQSGNFPYSEEYYADFLDDRDADWATTTAYVIDDIERDTITSESYKCLVDHTSGGGAFSADRAANPTYWELYEGEAITFEWELPWVDARRRMSTKSNRYIGLDTEGTASFTIDVYVDKLFPASATVSQALSLTFVGGDAEGYGGGNQPYGGGRRTADPRLWKFPFKYKIAKLVISGSSKGDGLKFIAISLLFSMGNFKR